MNVDLVGGRNLELDRYQRDLEALQSGRGGTMVFVGEPGIGKTRLLAELVNVAQSAGVPARVGTPSSLWPLGGDLFGALTGGVVALFVDDLHLLPGGSAVALEELIAVTATRPVLLAMACRPRQVAPAIGAVLSRAEASAVVRQIRIGPLSLADAGMPSSASTPTSAVSTPKGWATPCT